MLHEQINYTLNLVDYHFCHLIFFKIILTPKMSKAFSGFLS